MRVGGDRPKSGPWLASPFTSGQIQTFIDVSVYKKAAWQERSDSILETIVWPLSERQIRAISGQIAVRADLVRAPERQRKYMIGEVLGLIGFVALERGDLQTPDNILDYLAEDPDDAHRKIGIMLEDRLALITASLSGVKAGPDTAQDNSLQTA